MSSKQCPECDMWNTESATRCDCGYDFSSKQIKATYLDETYSSKLEKEKIHSRFQIIGPFCGFLVFVGIIMVLLGAMMVGEGDPGRFILGLIFILSGILFITTFGLYLNYLNEPQKRKVLKTANVFAIVIAIIFIGLVLWLISWM